MLMSIYIKKSDQNINNKTLNLPHIKSDVAINLTTSGWDQKHKPQSILNTQASSQLHSNFTNADSHLDPKYH